MNKGVLLLTMVLLFYCLDVIHAQEEAEEASESMTSFFASLKQQHQIKLVRCRVYVSYAVVFHATMLRP